ncbi:MAG: DUF262 domain-containing protein [Enhygromyxa sp.]
MHVDSQQSFYTPLSRRPQATTVSVKELIAKVRAGEVRIPPFQRPLRWKASDVLKLLDSVWRGYPIGSLLFWKREASAAQILVGGARMSAPAVGDAWWVVDGQQRISALAASLLELDHRDDKRWEVYFDPDAAEFVSPSPALSEHAVPVSVLGDLRRLGRWIREHDLEAEQIDRLEDAQQRLLDYTIPAYVVDTDDEDALRAVFARLNSSGARMQADEVFQALMAAPSRGRSSLDLDALQNACDRNDFGMPPRADVLKAVLAMSGLEPTSRPESLSSADLGRLVSYEAAEDALALTVGFLQDHCGIPHVRLIPYPVVFFVLARWFHIHRTSEPAPLARLAQWVWRGAMSGAHQRAEVSRMREQVRAIVSGDEQDSLDRLMAHVGSRPAAGWSLERFNQKNARSRIEMLALLALEPRDQIGPVQLRALVTGDRIAREIVASPDWEGLDPGLTRSAANRVVLDTTNTGLQRELRSWDAEKDEQALRSHLIGPDAFAALQAQDFGTFLRIRADAVAKHVAQFLEDRAQWDGPVVRPNRYYLDEQPLTESVV